MSVYELVMNKAVLHGSARKPQTHSPIRRGAKRHDKLSFSVIYPSLVWMTASFSTFVFSPVPVACDTRVGISVTRFGQHLKYPPKITERTDAAQLVPVATATEPFIAVVMSQHRGNPAAAAAAWFAV